MRDEPAPSPESTQAPGLRRLLFARSVAVVGASRNAGSVGGAIFRNLLQSGFTGTVFPVNSRAAAVGGVLAYPSLECVPGPVDLAVIAVPADQVAAVVDQCAAQGVPALVVISAGFGETDAAGKERQQALFDQIRGYGMCLVGPNCLGVLNTDPAVSLNATFAPVVPPPGRVSMGSQSGAVGLALLSHARSIDLGVAQFVSLGNKVDVSANDLLEFWEHDPGTDVILLYLESFGNPRKFSRIARRVARTKPIIVVKGGRSEVGARAAASHTGALAGADVAAETLFRQAGVMRADTIAEMFGAAQVLAHQPLPRGDRLAIVTNAGGPGILAADAAANWGLTVPPLAAATQAQLRTFLAREASVANPVDTIASARPEQIRRALAAVIADDGIDAVLLIYIPPLVTQPEEIAAALQEAVAGCRGEKPVVACFMLPPGRTVDLNRGPGRVIPAFPFPEDAVRALAHAYAYTRYRQQPEGQVRAFADTDPDTARALVRAALPGDAEGDADPDAGAAWLLPEQALALLAAYGIATVPTLPAATAAAAGAAAQRLGFPVAMKLRSASIVHKTDVGGIALGLDSVAAVEQAFTDLQQRLAAAGRAAEMQGVIVQPMAGPGQEVIVGMTDDAVFGPLLMVGLGGVQVEILQDVAFSLHPLTDRDPERMLARLRSLPLLTGWRGKPPRDVAALEETLLRFSALIDDLPEIDQIEVNPLFVYAQGQGCVAVDARVRVRARPLSPQPPRP